jgi:hypothetical protein
MSSAWVLGTVSLLATTVGALLIFLYLWKAPRLADDWQTPEGKRAYLQHQRRLIIGVGLLAAWLVVQGAAVILL